MRFNVTDKKPSRIGMAVWSAVCAAAAAILLVRGATEHAAWICAVCALFFSGVFVLLLAWFFGQLRYDAYSYNTIFFMGFALFFLLLVVTLSHLSLQLFRYPEEYGIQEILTILLNSSWLYMLLSFPLILVFALALCISNISLIRHEGKRLVNVLGIILSLLLILGAVGLYAFDFLVSGTQQQLMFHDLFANLFSAVYLYFECMLIGALISGLISARYRPQHDKDFLIVLGCGIRKDGTPTPLLRARLDCALAFARAQKAETGRDLLFVTSGGCGPDEVISESACMKAYLLSQGVPESRIIEEDRSTSTYENMKFSAEKIRAVATDGKVAYATTNYHVFRGGLYASRMGIKAVGMGAATKWYFWPNAAVREFVGLLTENRLKQALILTLIVLFYAVLTILVYR